jgi:hypothetical protein
MDPEQSREYEQISREIVVKLRHQAYIEDRYAAHAFQYLILPSFTPPISWDVFLRRHKGYPDNYVLMRTTWRSDIDHEKLRTPVERLRHPYPLTPTIDIYQLPTSSEELKILADELAAVELPIGASPGVAGIDGVTYEVAIGQPPAYFTFAARCRLSWWCEPPDAWSALRAWVVRAEKVFEAAWTGRGELAPIPVIVKAIDDAAAREEAKRLFREGHFGRAAQLLADVGQRENLTAAELKMLELAITRAHRSRVESE